MRMLSISALFLALSSAFLVYGLNYSVRTLEADVQAKQRLADELRGDLAVLKAERAHLARPERIEPLARVQGLRPLDQRQVSTSEAGTTSIVTGSAGRP